jgi:hypothetical protein
MRADGRATRTGWARVGYTFPSNLASFSIIALVVVRSHWIRQLEIALSPRIQQSIRLIRPERLTSPDEPNLLVSFHKMKTTIFRTAHINFQDHHRYLDGDNLEVSGGKACLSRVANSRSHSQLILLQSWAVSPKLQTSPKFSTPQFIQYSAFQFTSAWTLQEQRQRATDIGVLFFPP